jgi:hypothetical protein
MAAAATTNTRDLTAEISFLARALKAPTMRDAMARLAERARAESWTHKGVPRGLPCNARSPPENPTAVKAESEPRVFRPVNRWRTSTSTTPAV